MSASLCQAVTDQAASQEMLETIERANLFLVPLDDGRHWYRFHDLFREALLARLQATRPETVPLLHQRAARWYEEHGEFREAISHWLAAQDFSSAVCLMKQKVRSSGAGRGSHDVPLDHGVARRCSARTRRFCVNRSPLSGHRRLSHRCGTAHPGPAQGEQLMNRVEHTVFLGDRGVEIGAETDTRPPETERTRIRRRLHLLRLYIEMQRIELNGFHDRFHLVAQQVLRLDQDDEIVWQMIPLAATFLLHYSYQLQGALAVSQFLEAKQRADLQRSLCYDQNQAMVSYYPLRVQVSCIRYIKSAWKALP